MNANKTGKLLFLAFSSAFMLAPSLALALACARASVAALRYPIFVPGKIVSVHLRFLNIQIRS
jgi:hypothetical protein